ncbi:hypothetical protein Pan44_28430 [Caulifigura coniformis]|uniref:Uncharacterized protein n=1 Tax=Caulifigura coniformis TaxID=2527983 RepID=A0A517SF84_9PLAN|nr:hypothetical protein [Caulifigura coniformis]QDT54805.1 hypothetical protein Pan44_28430 [Caulifigura coniformis]
MTLWQLLVVHAQIMGVITLTCIAILGAIDLVGSLLRVVRSPAPRAAHRPIARSTAAPASARTSPVRSFAHLLN